MMDGQISIKDYMANRTFTRNGREYEAPAWMRPDRCENCKYWERLSVEDQPPEGWGVLGQCGILHSPKQVGYQNTSKSSYCDLFEWR